VLELVRVMSTSYTCELRQLLLIFLFVSFLVYPRNFLAMPLPSCMKCIVYGRESLLLQTRPIPKPRRGHVLVRVEAAGLNPVDAKEIVGDKLPHSWTYARSCIRSVISGKIPGFDFAGTCVVSDEVGGPKTGNDQFSDGAKVFGTMPPFQGTLAEYISVPVDQICVMPENLKFEEAAALPLVG
jgi:NADPH:quinone reductase-like Zn-dependent oxidoreductase